MFVPPRAFRVTTIGLAVLLSANLAGCKKPKPPATAAAPAGGPTADEDVVYAPMGMMVGEVTTTSALVQVRLASTDKPQAAPAPPETKPGGPEITDVPGGFGYVQFTLINQDDSGDVQVEVLEANGDFDFIARAHFEGLKPNTRYQCQSRIMFNPPTEPTMGDVGPTAEFRTLAGAETSREVKFVVVTGMNYAKFHGDNRIDLAQHKVENNRDLPKPYDRKDKHLGYPALATILKMKPDFFVGTGDNVYYDTPDNPRAESIDALRQKWHEQFVQPRYVSLFGFVPTYWEIDDHDYRIDDGDNSGDYLPSPKTARRTMIEQLPVAPYSQMEYAVTYRTHRVSKELQVWFVENRMHRSDNAMEDGPEKSIWGAAQRGWLQKTLKESDAPFKVLVSPTPMVGPDDVRKTDNHTNVNGFQHERDAFFQWVLDNDIKGFRIVCGDRHWQYHAVHPTGIEEISCGALVDANSRPGRKAGDPQSTDPEGTIKQPYLQTDPSGGFLMVSSRPGEPAELVFEHFDERGEPLYSTTVKAD